MPSARLRPNSPPVVHETLDGETIMVNLDTGTYYSLDPVAARIWLALEHGAAPAEITSAVAAGAAADTDTVREAIDAFVAELLGDGLMVEREEEPATGEHT